ncbi:MAG: hypothetical protein A3C43_03230 [Candidatus Schekmanbacteria bacterium RIFCSPHIGHO2_02_FULL_38_11]|uniref:Uncharacterized protein n=1 Tax=Candidatus Schekmanbacteria bacterium RIFCSPLOWO2_12_FULL_38_15 TaxID=1817883 RepID=A0A1F7SN68_9BACT|nr:MAG: hypothetical protein A2043_02995 [Candidatus Schekmanbacteria bacterium GWA2_38_9]OGL50106.1 MAG: hypothetical protein A3H37_07315 [Candidatus Schekmanbacteria bacterium RIFCSPLOWO2_02_FULL_38_14]OGL54292.1 MAG: hypothetical protein A3C43_03230 [Candidatus Schekmanbacteria bacterium RIFCSPHIGHO2_02_FULL_38_11]OGL55216.1 MAG: hypothetical protein A3G31_09605 [Candidatus Schekmanbacteria bacterium RIFCSPLOWO2_12_FULL_38_15]
MKKSTYVLIIGVILLFVILNYLPKKHPTKIPIDETHKSYSSDKACLECHNKNEDKEKPLGKKHPIKTENCVKCHNDKTVVSAR